MSLGNVGVISIHATREGGDSPALHALFPARSISIHATREGGDRAGHCKSPDNEDFNPRHP